jgi:hypothetical protein
MDVRLIELFVGYYKDAKTSHQRKWIGQLAQALLTGEEMIEFLERIVIFLMSKESERKI